MLRRRILPFLSLALLASPALAASSPPAPGGAEIGHVVAVEGRATATIPGQLARVLVCGDPVYEDERLATERGARLVVARDGRHVHLGPESLMVQRNGLDERPLAVLLRGSARLLDTAAAPLAHVATSAGTLRFAAPDVELRRLATGALQICDWSRGTGAACRRFEPSGQIQPVAEEGPRLDLGIRNVCEWDSRDGVWWADFASPPPVAARPESPFEPEFEPPEPGCAGDECTPSVDPPEVIIYTVAPPIIFIP